MLYSFSPAFSGCLSVGSEGTGSCRNDSSSGFRWVHLEEAGWREKIEVIDKRMIEGLV